MREQVKEKKCEHKYKQKISYCIRKMKEKVNIEINKEKRPIDLFIYLKLLGRKGNMGAEWTRE